MTPRRIQMTRHKPWRPDNPDAIRVDRSTRFGNPFVIGWRYAHYPHGETVRDAAHAVDLYRSWLLRTDPSNPDVYDNGRRRFDRREVHRHMWELVGNDLACWCGPFDACHASVLLQLCNVPAPADGRTDPL